MVGLCGTIGGSTQYLDPLTEAITWLDSDESTNYTDGSVGVGYADHPIEFDEQPATTGDVAIWCWGDVIGHEYKGTYTPRTGDLSDAEYCAKLYDRHGLNFVAGLNSEFAGVIYDRSDETVSIFTDRLGSRPIYYTHSSDGSLVFSSLLQTIGVHPDVELDADPAYLAEYFTYSRVFGTKTPVSEIYNLPPASVFTFDLNGELVGERKYWWPVSRPRDFPFSEFTNRFSSVIERSIRERISSDRDQGLLLSGGADSRLILEFLSSGTTAFHMNEYFDGNREAQTAKRVADLKNADFSFLQRDSDYYPSVFEQIHPIYNFSGLFHHAHALGFSEKIRKQADEVFCGHYSDTILGDTYVPMFLNNIRLLRHLIPTYRPRDIENTNSYIDALHNGEVGDYNGHPSYLKNTPHSRSVMSAEVGQQRNQVVHHEVTYPSWESLVRYGGFYPISNTKTLVFYETLNQAVPTRYPFLDNRIIDLALRMPDRYLYQYDLIASSLKNMNPVLAEIPHSDNRMPIKHPYYVKHYSSKIIALINKLQRRITTENSTTDEQLNTNGSSWPNHGLLLRNHNFIRQSIDKNCDVIKYSNYFDVGEIQLYLSEHSNGTNHTNHLYALASVLESRINLSTKDD